MRDYSHVKNKSGENFDCLEPNYFSEYEICLHGNHYNSERYKRLSAIKVNKIDVNKKKKLNNKKKTPEYTNYFEFRYPSASSGVKRFESFKNISNKIKSKVDSNFQSVCIRKNEKYTPTTSNINSLPSLKSITHDPNDKQDQDNNINSNINIISNKFDNNNTEIENKENTTNNKRIRFNDKLCIINNNNSNNSSINTSINNDGKQKFLTNDYKKEFFSTELLLLQDNDDIFHINEDLFTAEQHNDVLLLEKNNYNIKTNNFNKSNQKENEQQKKTKDANSDIEDNSNNVNVYHSIKRKNLKNIGKVIRSSKNMSKRNCIYTNFDYSDTEYGDENSYSSSSSEDYKIKKIYRKKKKISKKNDTRQNKKDINDNYNNNNNNNNNNTDTTTTSSNKSINDASKNADSNTIKDSNINNSIDNTNNNIGNNNNNTDKNIDNSINDTDINMESHSNNRDTNIDNNSNNSNKNIDNNIENESNSSKIKENNSNTSTNNSLVQSTARATISNSDNNNDNATINENNINNGENIGDSYTELESELSKLINDEMDIDQSNYKINNGSSKDDLSINNDEFIVPFGLKNSIKFKNEELNEFVTSMYISKPTVTIETPSIIETNEEMRVVEEDEALSKYMLPNLRDNDQQRKNCIIDEKRQLKKCREILDEKKENFVQKEEQIKRERDKNIDSSEQNLKMTNVIKNILERLKYNKNYFKLNKELIQNNMDDIMRDMTLDELFNVYHKELDELKGEKYKIIPTEISREVLRKNIIKKRIVTFPRMKDFGLKNNIVEGNMDNERRLSHTPAIYFELQHMFNDEYNTLKRILRSKKQDSIDLSEMMAINDKKENLQKVSVSEDNICYKNSLLNEKFHSSQSCNSAHHRRHHHHHHLHHKSTKIRHNHPIIGNSNIGSIYRYGGKDHEKSSIIRKHKKGSTIGSLYKYRSTKLSKYKIDKSSKSIKDDVEENKTLEKINELEYLKNKSNYIIKHTLLDNGKYNRIPTPYSSLDYDLYIASNQHKFINKIKNGIIKKKKEESMLRERKKSKFYIIQANKSLAKRSKSRGSKCSTDEEIIKPFAEEGNNLYTSMIYHPEVLKKTIIKNLAKNELNQNIHHTYKNSNSNNSNNNSNNNTNNNTNNNDNNNNNDNTNNDNNDNNNNNNKDKNNVNDNDKSSTYSINNNIFNIPTNSLMSIAKTTDDDKINNNNSTGKSSPKETDENLNKSKATINGSKNNIDTNSNNNDNNNEKQIEKYKSVNRKKGLDKISESKSKHKTTSPKVKNNVRMKDINTSKTNIKKKIRNPNSKSSTISGLDATKQETPNNDNENKEIDINDNKTTENDKSINEENNNNDINDNNNKNNDDVNSNNSNANTNSNSNNNINTNNANADDENENNSNSNKTKKRVTFTPETMINMVKQDKHLKQKLLSKGINIDENEDIIRDMLNDRLPESTYETQYIRVNDIMENNEGENKTKVVKNPKSKRSEIMEEFNKINETAKRSHALYSYAAIDIDVDFYDYDDLLPNIDMVMPKDKFIQEISLFDDFEKFKETMKKELLNQYKIKPNGDRKINMNEINDSINCAFSIMGYNRERKKLVDDEKTIWHQQINEASELYDKLIQLGIDVDKRIIMNAIVSPKDVLHLNKENDIVKKIRNKISEDNLNNLAKSKKNGNMLFKSDSLKDSNGKNGKSNKKHGKDYNNSNYSILDSKYDRRISKKLSAKWESIGHKIDCYNQLSYNNRLRNMVKYFVKKRRECKKEIKENYISEDKPFISSFPRRYKNEPTEYKEYEVNYFYSDNYINPYHNYSCLFIDDMALFSYHDNYYFN